VKCPVYFGISTQRGNKYSAVPSVRQQKSSKKSQHASRHYERTHLGKKNAECEICGKKFTSVKNYQAHVLIHQGLKPFKCEECGKEFRRGDKLRDHLKQVHGPNSKLIVECEVVVEKKMVEKKIVKKKIIETNVEADEVVVPVREYGENFNKFVESESIYLEQIKNIENEKNGDKFKNHLEMEQGEIVEIIKTVNQAITIETVPNNEIDTNPTASSIPEASDTVPSAPPPPEVDASKQLPDLPLLTPRPTSYRDPAPVLPKAPILFIGPPPKPLETEDVEEIESIDTSEPLAESETSAAQITETEKLVQISVGSDNSPVPASSIETLPEKSPEKSLERSKEKSFHVEKPQEVKSTVIESKKVPGKDDCSEIDCSVKNVAENSENKVTSDDAPAAKKRKRNLSSPNEQSLSREQLAHLVGKNHESDDLSFGDVMNWESINPKMDMRH